VQVLFVLLHEYAHITLGHLNENKLWQGHPLTSDSAEVFASSFQKEYEADEQAFRWLMEGDWSSLVEKDFLFGENNAPYIISELFVWLSGIAPANQSSYYAIPRSHPHPLDRAKNLLRYASNIGWGSDELDRVFEYEAAIVKSF
jgi:Zn-dependent protease with chaperone function